MINDVSRQEMAQAIVDYIGGVSTGYMVRLYSDGPSFDPARTDPSSFTFVDDWVEGASQSIAFGVPSGDTDSMVSAGTPVTWTGAIGGTYPVIIKGQLVLSHDLSEIRAQSDFAVPLPVPSAGSSITTTSPYTEGQLAP